MQMDSEVCHVLDEIVELGYVFIRDGQVVATRPKNNLCSSRYDRWTPTIKYLKDYAQHHEDFGGEFFLCLYDGWREYSTPSDNPKYIPWSQCQTSLYLSHGVAGEPRFRHSFEANPDEYPELPLKVMTYNAHKNDRNVCLIPDAEFLENEFKSFSHQVRDNEVAWEQKVPIAFWRGSRNITPGHEYGYLKTTSLHPREFVVRNAQNFGINASWSHSPICDQLKFKYLLDIDGMVNAWSGLYWKMLSNSVVLKHKTHWHQWYYPMLEEWKHFVPVETMPALSDTIDWCKKNDHICKDIAKNATSFAEKLTYDYAVREYKILT